VAEAVVTDAAQSCGTAAFFCAEGERLGWSVAVIECFIPEADAEWEREYGPWLCRQQDAADG
jgi:hypothetical protein